MKYVLTLLFGLGIISASAQVFTGFEDVCPNKSYNYTYTDDVQYNDVDWNVSGGTEVSGTGTSRMIKWYENGSVTVTLLWNGNPVSTLTKFVELWKAGSISGPGTVCAGGSVNLNASGYNITGTTLSWASSTDGINFSHLTSGVTSLSVSPTVPTWYRVTVTNCGAQVSNTHQVVPKAIPTPTFNTGPTAACTGSTGNVYTTESGMSNYAWNVSGGTVTAGGGTSDNTVTVTWPSAGARSVSVNYTSNGCTAPNPTVRNVSVSAAPTPTFTEGPTTVCVGTGGHVYSTQSGMSNYVWTVSTGGTKTAGGGPSDNTVTVTWDTFGTPRGLKLNYTNASGCSAPGMTSLDVEVVNRPTASLDGPTAVCLGSTGHVYTTSSNASNYVWTVTGGGTITSGGTSSSHTATITWTSAGSVSVSYTHNYAGCIPLSPTVKNVTVNAVPTPTFTEGPTSACVGSTGNVYTTESGMSNYAWNVSGGTVTAGGGTSDNTVTVTWPSVGARSVSVNYTSNGCTAASPTVRNVSVGTVPTPTFTGGPTTVCVATGGHVYSTQAGMSNYQWTVSTGATITAGGGPSDNTATVTWDTFGTPRGVKVNYANASGCSAPVMTYLDVSVANRPTGSLDGLTTVCAGSTGNVYTAPSASSDYVWAVTGGGTITAGGTPSSNTATITWTSSGSVSVSYTNIYSGCSPLSPAVRDVTVNAVPTPTFTEGPTTACAGSTGNVYTTQSGMSDYTWNVVGGTVTAGGGTSDNTVTVTWSSAGAGSVSVNYTSNGCTAANPTVKNVSVGALPTPTFTGGPTNAYVGTGGHVYSTQAGMSNYAWSVSAGGTITAGGGSAHNTATVTWNSPGPQEVTINYTNASGCIVAPKVRHVAVEFADMNYVQTVDYKKAGFISPPELDNLAVEEYTLSTTYMDELGRQVQTVGLGTGGTGKDMIQVNVYDEFGREPEKYLPYAGLARDGHYQPDALTEQADFYSMEADVAHDSRPFSKTVFESSPLNRPVKDYGVGEAWSEAASNKFVSYKYQVNVHGTAAGQEKIVAWNIHATNFQPVRASVLTGFIVTGGHYETGQLTVSSSTDEEGFEVREYTNKAGQVILKKVQVVQGASSLANREHWAQTYYVYDDLGRLRHVLPPELSYRVHVSDTYNPSTTDLDNWAYQYTYDARGRMATKKLPGAGPVYMVYDSRNRLVLTQDANQRAGATNSIKYWTFTKYDLLNRPIMTGIKDTTTTVMLTQEQMQGAVDTFYSKASSRWGETYVAGAPGNIYGYTNRSYPVRTVGNTPDGESFLTVTYFDDYDFKNLFGSTQFDFRSGELPPDGPSPGQETTSSNRTLGQVTGTRTRMMTTATWLKSVAYYDERGRNIQTVTENNRGFEVSTSVIDLVGRTLRTSTSTFGSMAVSWVSIVNAAVSGDRLTSTAGTNWNAGAVSAQVLPAGVDGWAECTVLSTSPAVAFGLSDANMNTNPNTTDFHWNMNSGNGGQYENGTAVGSSLAIVPGDVLRIERVNGKIHFKRNGVIRYTSSTPSSTQLMVDVSLFSNGAKFTNGRVSHTFSSYSTSPQIVSRRFTYDHASRLKSIYHRLGTGGTEVMLSQLKYNAIGQLIDKNIHSTNGTTFKQQVDFGYNIRGWMSRINNSDLTILESGPRDFFGMDLFYNESSGTSNTGLFNGNISAMRWSSNLGVGNTESAYNFNYDPLGRLTDAVSRLKTAGSWGAGKFNEYGIKYDQNGNIKELKRTWEGEQVDNLLYDYGGPATNKLLMVSDLVSDPADKLKGFRDNIAGYDFSYDSNGNVLRDFNKGMSSNITYNHMNLPEMVSWTIGSVRYLYDATGKKHGQIASYNSSQVMTEYVNDWVYENGIPQFVQHEEGRVVLSSPTEFLNYSCDDASIMTVTSGTVTLSPVTINEEKYVSVVGASGTSLHHTGIATIGGSFPVSEGQRYVFRAKGYATGQSVNMIVMPGYIVWPGAALPIGQTKETWVETPFTIPYGVTQITIGFHWNSSSTAGDTFYLNEIQLIQKGANGVPEYQYDLKDHLGNVRLTFTTEEETEAVQATLETPTQAVDRSNFLRYDDARRVSSFLFDHTGDTSSPTTVYSNDFSSSTSPFYGTGTFAVSLSSGRLKGSGASQWDPVLMTFATIPGHNYKVTFDIDLAGSTAISLFGNDPWTGTRQASTQITSNGTYTITVTSQNVNFQIFFQNGATTPRDIYLDNMLIEDISPAGVYAQRLNGSANEKYGLARSMSVMPGDIIKMEVYAKYVDTNPGNRTAFLNTLISQIASGTLAATRIDGSGYTTSTSSFPHGGVLSTTGSTGGPKAFLNWLVYDRNDNYLEGGYRRLSDTPKETGQNVAHEKLWADIEIKQAGYVYVYLSNEETSPVEVYFDDFRVEQVKSLVVQAQDYYPFGLTYNSYSRENSTSNRYLYNQGSGDRKFLTERVFELGLGVDLSKERTYDYLTGRWWQIDPKADKESQESWSPYNYSFNNSIRYNDPKGDCPMCLTAGAGAIIGAIAGAGIAAYNGGDWGDIGKAALAGGIGGAIIGSGAGLLASGAVVGTGLTSSTIGVVVTNAAIGMISGGAEETTKQALSDQPMNTAAIVKAAGVGGLSNAIAGPFGSAVAKPISNALAPVMKSLGNAVANSSRPIVVASAQAAASKPVKALIKEGSKLFNDVAQKTVEDKVQDKLEKR